LYAPFDPRDLYNHCVPDYIKEPEIHILLPTADEEGRERAADKARADWGKSSSIAPEKSYYEQQQAEDEQMSAQEWAKQVMPYNP
jgi:hypothetical protein